MANQDLGLVKEVYEHIILQYQLLEDANEKLSQKGVTLIGFSGVVLGLVVKLFLDRKTAYLVPDLFSYILGFLIIVFLILALYCFLIGTKISTFTSLVTPSFLVSKLNDGTPKEKFWEQFVIAAQKAYHANKINNADKSRWIKTGTIFFVTSLTSLLIYALSLM